MARLFLDHIDSQAGQIAALKEALISARFKSQYNQIMAKPCIAEVKVFDARYGDLGDHYELQEAKVEMRSIPVDAIELMQMVKSKLQEDEKLKAAGVAWE